MKVELRIALRYLFSRKSHNAVNVISAVAMAGVAVAAAAMIVVLSVFNGFASLIDSKTSTFNPPYLLTRTDGAVIANADSLSAIYGGYPIIDEQAFAIAPTGSAQMPVNFRALPFGNLPLTGLDRILVDGSLPTDSASILSVGVAMQLNLHPGDSITICIPRRLGRINPGAPTKSFRSVTLPVAAVYQVEQDAQDRDMLIIPLSIARNLLSYTTEATALAANQGTLQLPECRGEAEDSRPYRLLDRRAQEADSFRMIAIEKWITFLMLAFILLIASFNIISTLSLMMVEKKGNMAVLRAMGATPRFIRNIFANQAWLITLGGGIVGLILGALLILGQQHFGWVPLTTSNPAVLTTTSYPVMLLPSDLLVCLLTILLLSLFLTIITRKLKGQQT